LLAVSTNTINGWTRIVGASGNITVVRAVVLVESGGIVVSRISMRTDAIQVASIVVEKTAKGIKGT